MCSVCILWEREEGGYTPLGEAMRCAVGGAFQNLRRLEVEEQL